MQLYDYQRYNATQNKAEEEEKERIRKYKSNQEKLRAIKEDGFDDDFLPINVVPNLKKQDVIEIAISASHTTDMSKANVTVEIKDNSETKNKKNNSNDHYDDENFGPTNKKNEKSSNISEKFRRVGIIGSESDFYGNNEKEEDFTDPLSYPYITDEANKKQNIQVYIAYERIQEVCLGVRSFEAASGLSRFNVGIEGLDFFPIFPIPPSLQKPNNLNWVPSLISEPCLFS